MQPFCGNAVSAADTEPSIGVCGKCKLSSDGSGGTSSCDATAHAAGSNADCIDTDNTCSGTMVCCKDGSCQTDSSTCPEV